MKVGITGSSSDIGKELFCLLESKGYVISKFGRDEVNHWKIGQKFPKSNIEVLFHLAHDRKLTFSQNREAVDRLTATFEGKIVYISSTSAHPQALSNYGKSKYVAQQLIDDSGGTSVVSGLIYGNEPMSESSMITQISEITKKYPILPIPFAIDSRFYFSEIRTLAQAMVNAAESDLIGSFKAFSTAHLSLGDLIAKIGEKNNCSPRILRLPDIGFSKTLRIASKFLPFPGILDSFLSMVNEIPPRYITELKTFPDLEFPVWV